MPYGEPGARVPQGRRGGGRFLFLVGSLWIRCGLGQARCTLSRLGSRLMGLWAL